MLEVSHPLRKVHPMDGAPIILLLFIEIDLVSAAQLGEQAENLQIEPDQRDNDAEGAVPLHILGCAELYALLDEVEVEHQIQRRDGRRQTG